MKKLLILTCFASLLFLGCGTVLSAKEEATQAVQNLTDEAVRVKTSVETTANQVKEAVDSVNSAVEATQNAVESVKSIGNNENTSLSSED